MAVYKYNGKVLKIGGKIATSVNCCCNEFGPCDGCCMDTMPQFADVTLTEISDDVVPGDCDCTLWNDTFTLSRVSVAGSCYWELLGGPCGNNPYFRLTPQSTPCDNPTRQWTLDVYFDYDDPSAGNAQYIHHSTEALTDCEAYWAAMANFTMQRSTEQGECKWTDDSSHYNVSVSLHN